MGILLIDWTEARDDLVDAIQSYKDMKDIPRVRAEVFDAAQRVPSLNAMQFTEHTMKLLRAGVHDRALRLVGAMAPLEQPARSLRSWARVLLLILFWPFMLIYRVIKMGIP